VQTGTQRDQVALVRPYPLGIIIHSQDEVLYGGVFNSVRHQRDAIRDASPAYEFVSPAEMRTARPVFSRLGRTSKRDKLSGERGALILRELSEMQILQHPMLLALQKHPALQRKVLTELATNLQLQNKLLWIAGD
jgi:hypothetical protein